MSKKDISLNSWLIHGPYQSSAWDYSHHVVPPQSASSTFRLDSVERGAAGFCGFAELGAERFQRSPVYIYDRLDEPTRAMLEERLARLESGEAALCFATGMAAISAVMGAYLKSGDHVLANSVLYGCTYSLLSNWLPRQGIQSEYLDFTSGGSGLIQALNAAVRANTRMVYLESPVNPTMSLVDLRQISAWVRGLNQGRREDEKILLVVDNTFATPWCQRPIELGADIVVHSLTKNICGFGTHMGGAVILKKREWESPLLVYRKDFGGVLGPTAAWNILTHGLPTLGLRLERQMATAQKVSDFLEGHEAVAKVHYPGAKGFAQADLARAQMTTPTGHFAPGAMLYFETKAERGADYASKVANWIAKNAPTITLAVSLGQVRTLIETPSQMTHSALPEAAKKSSKIPLSGLRISIGLEDAEDIISDLHSALSV